MNLIRIFVRRPVLTSMILVLMLVMGIYAYQRLSVEMMPRIDFPVIVHQGRPSARPDGVRPR